jgi:hypothetical protein
MPSSGRSSNGPGTGLSSMFDIPMDQQDDNDDDHDDISIIRQQTSSSSVSSINHSSSANSTYNGSQTPRAGKRPRTADNEDINNDTAAILASSSSATNEEKDITMSNQSNHINNNSVTDPQLVPIWVGRDKLLGAGIDNARTDCFSVTLQIDQRFPNSPTVDPIQYKCNAAARTRYAATLLGGAGEQSLGIIAPLVPRVLLEENAAMNTEQQAWLALLQEQMTKHAHVLRDPNGAEDSKLVACKELLALLEQLQRSTNKDGNAQQPLWPSNALLNQWTQLLTNGSAITRSSVRAPPSTSKGQDKQHAYTLLQLRIHAANPLVAYILLGVITAYSLLKGIHTELTTKVTKAIEGPAANTTSSESGPDSGRWEVQHHGRPRNKQQHTIQRIRAELKKLSTASEFAAQMKHFTTVTLVPLLALVTKVVIRPITEPYVSFLLNNFQSLGCEVDDLENDANYNTLIQLSTAFAHPHAHWQVHQSIANATVSVWIREENKDLIANLNDMVVAEMGIPGSALSIACSVAKKHKNGSIDHRSSFKVFLTNNRKAIPLPMQQRPTHVPQPVTNSTHPGKTWASRVGEAARMKQEAAERSKKHTEKSQPQHKQGLAAALKQTQQPETVAQSTALADRTSPVANTTTPSWLNERLSEFESKMSERLMAQQEQTIKVAFTHVTEAVQRMQLEFMEQMNQLWIKQMADMQQRFTSMQEQHSGFLHAMSLPALNMTHMSPKDSTPTSPTLLNMQQHTQNGNTNRHTNVSSAPAGPARNGTAVING